MGSYVNLYYTVLTDDNQKRYHVNHVFTDADLNTKTTKLNMSLRPIDPATGKYISEDEVKFGPGETISGLT
jgi:hypothetical protein